MSEIDDGLNEELNAVLGGGITTAPAAKKKTASKKKVAVKKATTDNDTPKTPEKKAKPSWGDASKRADKPYKYAPGEMRTVMINKERGKGGDRPVPVNYNGKQYTVPRGVKCQVPAPVAHILENAEEILHEWIPKENTIEQRTAAAYPVVISAD